MSKLKSYREAKRFAEQRDKKLTGYDFKHSVLIKHGDGSVLFFNYAFLEEKEGWIFVFTEHHGPHIYHKEDLDGIKQYKHFKKASIQLSPPYRK